MEIPDVLVFVSLLALVVTNWAQVYYNRAVTDLLLFHGKEIDSLREVIGRPGAADAGGEE